MTKREGPHAAEQISSRRALPGPPDPQAPVAGDTFLTPAELAARWKITPKSLSNARWAGTGLPYLKVGGFGGAIRYRLSDVEAYERARTFRSTTEAGSAHSSK